MIQRYSVRLSNSVFSETLYTELDSSSTVEGTESRNENLNTVRERLNVVTQETRFSLVQDILGHPSGLPTLKELNYVNPNRSQTTIRQHLQQLIEADIVEKVELPENRRQNDLPYTFYGLSEEGRRFLEEHKLLRAEETLQEIYDQVEKTAEVERYESAQRPEG